MDYIYVVRCADFEDRAFTDKADAIQFVLNQMWELGLLGVDSEQFSSNIYHLFNFDYTDTFEINKVALDSFVNYGEEVEDYEVSNDEDADEDEDTDESVF